MAEHPLRPFFAHLGLDVHVWPDGRAFVTGDAVEVLHRLLAALNGLSPDFTADLAGLIAGRGWAPATEGEPR